MTQSRFNELLEAAISKRYIEEDGISNYSNLEFNLGTICKNADEIAEFLGILMNNQALYQESDTEYILGQSFLGNKYLKDIVISDNIKYIYNSAFAESSLSSIILSSNVSNLGNNVFEHCLDLTKADLSKSKLTYIPYASFRGDSNLRVVFLPDTLSHILSNAFKDCTSLQYIDIPEEVSLIMGNSFDGCISLNNIHYLDMNFDSIDEFMRYTREKGLIAWV